jgi:hypothetical protein
MSEDRTRLLQIFVSPENEQDKKANQKTKISIVETQLLICKSGRVVPWWITRGSNT